MVDKYGFQTGQPVIEYYMERDPMDPDIKQEPTSPTDKQETSITQEPISPLPASKTGNWQMIDQQLYADAKLSTSINLSDHHVGEDIIISDLSDNNLSAASNDSEDVIFLGEEKAHEADDNESNPDLVCQNCDLQCSIENYEMHTKLCGKKRNFPCPFPTCSKVYRSLSMARNHFRSVHQSDSYVCNTDGCGRTFVSKGTRKAHIERVHLKVTQQLNKQHNLFLSNEKNIPPIKQQQKILLKHTHIKKYPKLESNKTIH